MSEPQGALKLPERTPLNQLYVYYKVQPEQRTSAALAVADLLSFCQTHGVKARLMRRSDASSDGTETWMEVYDNPTGEFEQQLGALVQETGVDRLVGERRLERFIAF